MPRDAEFDIVQYTEDALMTCNSQNPDEPNLPSQMPCPYAALKADEADDKLIKARVPSSAWPKGVNVVATCNAGCMIEPRHIAQHARNVEYNPKRFPAAVCRIRQPGATAMIFKSGKMIVNGTKCAEDSKLACRKFVRMLCKMGYAAKFDDYKVVNVVSNADMGFTVRLEGLAHKHNRFASFEPELFGGLVYRMMRPKVVSGSANSCTRGKILTVLQTLLVFTSGKVIVTGARNPEEAKWSIAEMYATLCEFRL